MREHMNHTSKHMSFTGSQGFAMDPVKGLYAPGYYTRCSECNQEFYSGNHFNERMDESDTRFCERCAFLKPVHQLFDKSQTNNFAKKKTQECDYPDHYPDGPHQDPELEKES